MARGLRIGHVRAFRMAAEKGDFVLTGIAAALKSGLRVTAAQGTYSTTGQATTLSQGGAGTPTETGLWGTDYSYSASIWTLTNRAGGAIVAPNLANNPANFIGSFVESKHTQSFLRNDGRVWHGVGDASALARTDVDGYDDLPGSISNQPVIYSFNPNSPTTVRREIGSHPTFNSANYDTVWACADEGFMVYDSDNDVAYVKPLRSDGYFQFPIANDPEVPSYVSANVIRFSGDVRTKYATGKALIVYLNHTSPAPGAGPNTPKRGRITGSNLNGGNTDVTLSWFDSMPTMSAANPPTGVRRQWEAVDGAQRVTGGWESSEVHALPRFNEATGKWRSTVMRINLTTRATSEVYFDAANKVYALLNPKNAIFVPAAKTGSGHGEIHCFGNDDSNPAAMVYDLVDLTLTVYTGVFTTAPSLNNDSMLQPQAAFDGERYAYVIQYCEGRLMKWDCRNRVEVWVKPVTIGGQFLFHLNALQLLSGNGAGPGPALYGEPMFAPLNPAEPRPVSLKDNLQLVWNAEISRLELYRIDEGHGDIFLIDPSKTTLTDASGAVEFIANRDQNGQHINGGWNVQHVPTSGSTPARTLLMGGITFEPMRAPNPDKLRTFVAANKRKWEELTVAPHPRITVTNGQPGDTTNSDLTNARSPSTETRIVFRSWGGFHVSREGRAYYLGGGHGDYHGTEVDNCDLTAMSGTSMPWRQNIGAPFNDANQEFRRPHVPEWLDDTGFDGLNNTGYGSSGSNWMWWKASENAWQHDACHMWTSLDSHPTLGLLMGPPGNVPTNLTMPANVRDHTNGYKSWSPTTGKWTAHTTSFSSGLALLLDYNTSMFCGYNRTGDYLLWYYNNGFADSRFIQYTPGGSQQMASVSVPTLLPNSWHGSAFWLKNNQFLIVAVGFEMTAKWWLYTHSLTSPSLVDVTPSNFAALQAGANSQNGRFCFDHDHDRIWYLYGLDSSKPRLFWSPLSDPANLREAYFADTSGFRPTSSAANEDGHEGMSYWNGYLWIATRGAPWIGASWSSPNETRFWRIPVYA